MTLFKDSCRSPFETPESKSATQTPTPVDCTRVPSSDLVSFAADIHYIMATQVSNVFAKDQAFYVLTWDIACALQPSTTYLLIQLPALVFGHGCLGNLWTAMGPAAGQKFDETAKRLRTKNVLCICLLNLPSHAKPSRLPTCSRM